MKIKPLINNYTIQIPTDLVFEEDSTSKSPKINCSTLEQVLFSLIQINSLGGSILTHN